MKLFKKREAFEYAKDAKKLNKDKKNDFKTSPFKFYDAYGTNVDSKDVMQKWVERRLIVRAENQIITREYLKGKFWKDFGWICIAALLVTIGFDYFVSASGANGLFPFGVGAFARFFAILTFPGNDQISMQSSFYFVYFFILNIPLMIFGWFKVGAKFTFLTLVYLVLQIAFDQILQVIPVINPNDWQIMVSTQEIGLIPTSWSNTVWLFFKAFVGAAILGLGYAIGYKAGSSSAGIDFVTMYLSLRKEKSIATINRNLNYFILFIIIILNTIILAPENFNYDIKYGQLVDTHNQEVLNNMINYVDSHKTLFSDGTIEYVKNLDLNILDTSSWRHKEFIEEIVKTDFNGFSSSMKNLMRFEFIFGPSLFASLILVIVSSLVTDMVYPTHKIKTYIIASKDIETMKTALREVGYRNNVMEWEADNELQGKVLDRNVLMLTMTATNWREVEPVLLEIDKHMTVNILKTDQVKGYFDYMIRSDHENEQANKILRKDTEWMSDIHEHAIVKTDREYSKYIKKRQSIIDKYEKIDDVYDMSEITSKKSLESWYKSQVKKVKKSEQRDLMELEHKWLLKWAQSQKQYDYIKKEYTSQIKALSRVNKKELHKLKKDFEIKAKELRKHK